MPEVIESTTTDTKVAVLQTNVAHLTDAIKDLRTGQEKLQLTIEKMTDKLDTAYVTKTEFFTFQTENFNPVKKKVDSLWWNLALLIGGGGSVVTLINWYLIYRGK